MSNLSARAWPPRLLGPIGRALLVLLLLTGTGCTQGSDADADGIADADDVCVNTPDPEQRDTDGDGYGDACDVVLTPIGLPSGANRSSVQVVLTPGFQWNPVGLLGIFNGTDEAQPWRVDLATPAPWMTVPLEGSLGGGEATTLSLKVSPEYTTPDTLTTSVTVTVGDQPPTYVDVILIIGKPLAKGVCQYNVTLTAITVVTRQALLIDGLALEPVVEVNAVGLGRTTSPPRGNHVLRAGQTVNPNVVFAVGQTVKGNNVAFPVIVDVDEIDLPPVNPNDLRNQGQTGVANFNFICDDVGRQTVVVPVPVIGNVPGEGNGMVEVEVEVDWDP